MKMDGNTILITGGATGIGFALAQAFIKYDNKVLICGRRESKLEEAKRKLPGVVIHKCDLSDLKGRQSLYRWVKDNYKELNVLINNAGIQRSINLRKGMLELLSGEDEIQTNFTAPIQLSALFAPLLLEKKEAAIINVSSGLGFVPMAVLPVYCATKAGVHMFTMSLRQQLKNTSVKVFEVIPPAVETELGRGTIDESDEGYKGILPSDVAVETTKAFAEDKYEVIIGNAKGLVDGSRKNFTKTFQELNSW